MIYPEYDVQHSVFFPLTGNPVGFHHLLLAECILSQFSEVKQIVFLLSNGKHPDPTKAKAIADKQVRLDVLQQAINEFNDPQSSFVAQVAKRLKFDLVLNPRNTKISTAEFGQDSPVALQEHVSALRSQFSSESNSKKVMLVVGGDLVHRMNNNIIFSDKDLNTLTQHCEFLIAPRNLYEIHSIVNEVQKKTWSTFVISEYSVRADA